MVLRAWNLAGHPFPNDDEGTYLAQAWAVRTGLGLSHYTYWYDHPPLGWMQLGALSWLPELMAPERTALVQGRTAMLPVAAVTSVLLYLVARRLGAGVVAAATVVGLNAVSPLAIALQRQVYLDSFAVMWFLASLALALSPKRNLWAHCACGVSFAVAVLSKETIAVLLPALVWALWQGSDRRTRGFSLAAFTAGAAVLLGYPLYSLLKGELFPGGCHSALVGALVWQIGSRGGSGSVFQPGTVANTLVMQWLRADPGLVIGGIVAGFAALALRGVRPLGTAVAFLVLVVCRPGGYLPKMYAVQVVPFLALALVLVVERAVRAGRARYGVQGPVRRTVAAVAVALMAAVLAFGRWPQFREVQRADLNAGYRAAGEWLNGPAVPDKRRARLVTDDVLWLDAVRAGFTPGAGVIWHYKLDKDPAIVASMPHGWRDIDFVLVTPTMREAQAELPTLKALLRHGEPVGDFAYGQIQALRVTGRSAEGAAGAPSVARSLLPCLREADDIWPYE
ncbi:hypothetical protein STVIR_8253 [Streptomyces viridochromogenes Tue57]|uniref:Glycosyltransferase RgtA/B/C/D-like domain-containing protein n=1 Tax=Streptomyces viridochromogenes Tue57 TaxID=1160705 RepID=L8P3V7_STRVR|nr:hypothetical protein STVIR_8253 [Streptomyces viridochromogenes Tue57]